MTFPSELRVTGNFHYDETGNLTTVEHLRDGFVTVANRSSRNVYFIRVEHKRVCYRKVSGIVAFLKWDVKFELETIHTSRSEDITLLPGASVSYKNGGVSNYPISACLNEYELEYSGIQTLDEYEADIDPSLVGSEAERPPEERYDPIEPSIWERVEKIALIVGIIAGAIMVFKLR